MEFIGQLIQQCGLPLFSPLRYQLEEIIVDQRKKLIIRFTSIAPYEIAWVEATCSVEDGRLTLSYLDHQVNIPFDKSFDYLQTKSTIDGVNLVVTIPGRDRVLLVPIQHEKVINDTMVKSKEEDNTNRTTLNNSIG
jgi:hypothetical protein